MHVKHDDEPHIPFTNILTTTWAPLSWHGTALVERFNSAIKMINLRSFFVPQLICYRSRTGHQGWVPVGIYSAPLFSLIVLSRTVHMLPPCSFSRRNLVRLPCVPKNNKSTDYRIDRLSDLYSPVFHWLCRVARLVVMYVLVLVICRECNFSTNCKYRYSSFYTVLVFETVFVSSKIKLFLLKLYFIESCTAM